MPSKKLSVIFLVLVFTGIFSLRLIHLGADPPSNLSNSMGYMSDPGGYVHNARNKTVFGKWEMDLWNPMYISPLPNYITYVIFYVIGPGIVQMNIVPALFSCLILIFSFLLFKRNNNTIFTFIGIILLGVNYQFTMFSRIAVRVMPMLFFVVLVLFFLNTKQKKYRMIFLAGSISFISFTVKGTFLQILPSIILGLALFVFFQKQRKIGKVIPPLTVFLLGLILLFSLWILILYLPNKEMVAAYGGENIRWLTPKGLLGALVNFWKRPLFFFNEMPIISLLSTLYLLIVFYRISSLPRKITLLDWIFSLWVITNTLYYSVIYYHPARHFVPLVIPLIFLATSFLKQLSTLEAIKKPKKIPLLFYAFIFFWLIFPLSSIQIINSRPLTISEMKTKLILVLIISFILTAITFLLIRLWPRNLKISFSKSIRISMIATLVAASIFVNMKPFLSWALNPHFHIRDISRDFGKAYDHMVIAGLLSPIISLENGYEAHPYRTGYINPYPDFLQKFNISHIFLTIHAGGIEKKQYQRDFPESMQKAKLVARYPLWKTYAELYDIQPEPLKQSSPDTYEGEIFFGKGGIPRFDPNAGEKFAFLFEKDQKDGLAQLTGKEYARGKYQAVFRLKVSEALGVKEERLARIYILSEKKEKLLAYKDLYLRDISPAGKYYDIKLPFKLNKKRKISLKIYSPGKVNLWVDKVNIQTLSKILNSQ